MGHRTNCVSHVRIPVPTARGAMGQKLSFYFNLLMGLSRRPTVRHGDIGTNMPVRDFWVLVTVRRAASDSSLGAVRQVMIYGSGDDRFPQVLGQVRFGP